MILVTGATGKIGSETVRLLAAAGVPTRALVRNPDKAKGWQGIEVVKGDLEDAASVAAALQGVDAVLLLTTANPKQEALVIEASKQAGVKKIVKISSMGASPDAKVSLGRGHAQSEELLKGSGLLWTILRPGAFAQNFLMFARSIRAEGRFSASVREGKIAPIDARDIAAVAVKALVEQGHEGKTYVLTGSQALSYAEAAAVLGAAIGKPVSYVDVPPAETRAQMVRAGLPEWLADDMVTMQAGIAGSSGVISTDVEKILGRPPRTFAEFARDHADAFR
jgi:(4-alkanoyl-5-oxo-2,5-dihydrofuran-3-yl)methyl phosphate reductase